MCGNTVFTELALVQLVKRLQRRGNALNQFSARANVSLTTVNFIIKSRSRQWPSMSRRLGVAPGLWHPHRSTGVFRPPCARKKPSPKLLLDAANVGETIEQAKARSVPGNVRDMTRTVLVPISSQHMKVLIVAAIDTEAMVIVGTDHSCVNDPRPFGLQRRCRR